MKEHTIQPNDFLKQEIKAFYHDDYYPRFNQKTSERIEALIYKLKNDLNQQKNEDLIKTARIVKEIIRQDLCEILNLSSVKMFTVCVVPRAKPDCRYNKNQLLFKEIIKKVVSELKQMGFEDGTSYITRIRDTKTTHLKNFRCEEGKMPYPGITKDTCKISDEVKDKDILLIDDLYTKTVNIVEDAIQALIDYGARSVLFYSLGKTIRVNN